jgi:hypothetical protein
VTIPLDPGGLKHLVIARESSCNRPFFNPGIDITADAARAVDEG